MTVNCRESSHSEEGDADDHFAVIAEKASEFLELAANLERPRCRFLSVKRRIRNQNTNLIGDPVIFGRPPKGPEHQRHWRRNRLGASQRWSRDSRDVGPLNVEWS